jgi:amino acid transporter
MGASRQGEQGRGQSGHGLRSGALSFFDAIVMALAGTAPAFSIAATTGVLIAAVGLASPAALLYCAVPMLGIAWAFAYLNRLEPDAGATYAWVGRALHPVLGFAAGWCVIVSVTLFMVSGSVPVASLTLSLFSSSLAQNLTLVTLLGCAWLLAVFCLVVFGVHISAKAQWIMSGIEIALLVVFAALALVHASHHAHVAFSWSWLGVTHFHGLAGFAVGALIAAFYYWGWDVTANLSEETHNSRRSAGAGGILGVVIVIVLFVVFTVLIQMIVPAGTVAANSADVLSALGNEVWPAGGGKVIVAAVMLSSLATVETALIQCTRTLLAMAKDQTMPAALGRVHRSWRTPWAAAITVTVVAVGLFAAANFIGSVSRLLGYAVGAIGLQIAIYYGLAGIAVTVAYRKILLRSLSNLIFMGVWPLTGGIFMLWVFGESIHSLGATADAVGLGAIGLGAIPLGYYFIKGSPALRRSAGRGPAALRLRADDTSPAGSERHRPATGAPPVDLAVECDNQSQKEGQCRQARTG